MGLFSRHQPREVSSSPATEKIYICVRSSDLSTTANLSWSLAILQNDKPATPTLTRESSPHARQRKALFSLTPRRDSAISMTSSPRPTLIRTNTIPKPSLHEYTLCQGKLKKTQHTSTTSLAHHTAIMNSKSKSSSTLLQILLPDPSGPPLDPRNPHHQQQALFTRIEEILHHVTTTNTNSNYTISSETWVKLCLIALQADKILPSPSSSSTTPGLNVETCLAFARNAFTGFEGECLREQSQKSASAMSSSGSFVGAAGVSEDINLGARYTKTIDYADHVRENERLRALFGHGGDAAVMERDGRGNASGSARSSVRKAYNRLSGISMSSGHGSGHSNGNGGWWVSRPNEARSTGKWWVEPQTGATRDVYAGLM